MWKRDASYYYEQIDRVERRLALWRMRRLGLTYKGMLSEVRTALSWLAHYKRELIALGEDVEPQKLMDVRDYMAHYGLTDAHILQPRQRRNPGFKSEGQAYAYAATQRNIQRLDREAYVKLVKGEW